MTNQVNQEALIANEFNKQYPYDDMNGWDRKLFKSGYQAATQASESEINSLKQRVEELEAHNTQLREALGHMVEGNVPEYDVNNYKKLLSSTLTQSLAKHDNATIERIATLLEYAEGEFKTLSEYIALVRKMKHE